MELGSYFLCLQEQIKVIIIIARRMPQAPSPLQAAERGKQARAVRASTYSTLCRRPAGSKSHPCAESALCARCRPLKLL